MPTGFDHVLEIIRETARTETGKGEKFERLMLRALPLFQETGLEAVVRRADLSGEEQRRWGLGNADCGVDLVGFRHPGRRTWVGIQCKCYGTRTRVTKADLDSFLALGVKDACEALIWVDTSERPFSRNLREALRDHSTWQRIDLDPLRRAGIY